MNDDNNRKKQECLQKLWEALEGRYTNDVEDITNGRNLCEAICR